MEAVEHEINCDKYCNWRALNSSKELESKPEELEIGWCIVATQTMVLLRSAKILRRGIETWETCRHLDFNERPSAYAGVKYSQEVS